MSCINRRRFMLLMSSVFVSLRVMAKSVERKIRVSLREAHKGTLEIDTRLLDSYGGPDDNVRQFYLDARKVFAGSRSADFSDSSIVKAAEANGVALMGGPMLGDLSDDGVTLWIRSAFKEPLSVRVSAVRNGSAGASPSHASLAPSVKLREGEAPAEPHVRVYSVKKCKPGVVQRVRVDSLSPDTAYQYAVMSGKKEIAKGSFATAPSADVKGDFRITFGSCCHKIGVHNTNLFNAILERRPAAMMFLGDIAVDDRDNKVNMHRADYQLRDVSKPWRGLAANIPVYASWDDHDYFNNDKSGVPKKYTNKDRDNLRAVWHSNWNNPSADDDRKGIYFNTRIGPVEIIMLDTRSCRENDRRNEYCSYLGEEQMGWLKKTLRESTAPFKVISSGTMWSDYVTKAKDSWGSWDKESREEIFDLIEKEKVGGVLLISGDRHGARGFRIPRPSGFTFYEFEAATLGGVPGPEGLVKGCKEQLFGYHGRDFVAFGEFIFDTTCNEPRVTFRLIDETGKIREEYAFKCADGRVLSVLHL